MPVLRARVPDEIANGWKALAEQIGVGQSELLRQAVNAVLSANSAQADAEAQSAPGEAKKRVRIELKPHELSAVERAARAMGWRRNTWIVSVVRTALFREPRPTDGEVAALYKATSELMAVGRNLNQLARRMHKDDRYLDTLTLKQLDEVRAVVSAQAESTSRLLERIENRWEPSFGPET